MNTFILVFSFILGISIGSFLGVVIDRLPKGKSIVVGRSHCDNCHHTLSWYDLFPLFSFLLLAGKCRYCKRFIGWNVLIIEVITGILFVLTTYYISSMYSIVNSTYVMSLIISMCVISSLIVIFFIDLFEGIIPDIILFPLTGIVFVYMLSTGSFFPHLISGLVSFLFFLLLFLGTKGRGMGFGDVKYAFFMGLFLGFPKILFGMYAAFLTGAVISLILVVWRKKRFFGGTIPFGPFLVFGTIFGFLWGDLLWQMVARYLF